ncbi:hypothetical protein EIP91_004762 [Steccherinum ochraceum]|uniref:Ketoreductase (KR) domain-containing protein n=1 Tax=Steccherinum ochraceum TaxID=92696 RepID=A0A4R0REB8_9APHY|nr:hypothetical protein EIP91_004762 [Steccherinum ochraceum]
MSAPNGLGRLPVPQPDLSGRTVLVVGCNVGLGFEAAKHLAQMNPKRLIGTCRTEEKCRKTEEEIQKATGSIAVECWPLELTSFASVRAFVDRFEREGGDRLDIALISAGMATTEYSLTEDGYETTVQTNHLSGALISYLLLPTLLKTAQTTGQPSRLAIVASGRHADVDFGADAFPKDQGIIARLSSAKYSSEDMFNRYPESKLLNVLFARALQAHLPPDAPVLVTSIDPGFCMSDLLRSINPDDFRDFFTEEVMSMMRPTEEGSRLLVMGAVGSEGGLERWRGAYVSNFEMAQHSDWVRSEEGQDAQERVWKETLEILTAVDARVGKTVELFSV